MSVFLGNTAANTFITSSRITRNGIVGQLIPSGTRVVFQQTTAPVGFTKDTSLNDSAMRVVNGSVGTRTNGIAFSTAFTSRGVSGTVGNTTLTADQMPWHGHGVYDPGHGHQVDYHPNAWENGGYGLWPSSAFQGRVVIYGAAYYVIGTYAAGSNIGIYGAGGSQPHNHAWSGSLDMTINYVDFILAVAN